MAWRDTGPGDRPAPGLTLCRTFAQVVSATEGALAVAVDMPIGLLDRPRAGGRDCDTAARRALGAKASSVFSAPARAHLLLDSFDDVRRIGGLSLQGYNLLPRVREVDALMTPALQRRIFEAHPELAFARLAGSPVLEPKRRAAGREARLVALERAAGAPYRGVRELLDDALARWPRAGVAADDVLDAVVLTHTAARHAAGRAEVLPPSPARDARGLQMAVWH